MQTKNTLSKMCFIIIWLQQKGSTTNYKIFSSLTVTLSLILGILKRGWHYISVLLNRDKQTKQQIIMCTHFFFYIDNYNSNKASFELWPKQIHDMSFDCGHRLFNYLSNGYICMYIYICIYYIIFNTSQQKLTSDMVSVFVISFSHHIPITCTSCQLFQKKILFIISDKGHLNN